MSDPGPEEGHVPSSESEEIRVPSDSEARSPLIADKKSRFKVNFVEAEARKSEGDNKVDDTVHSHHDSTIHRSQSTFQYKVFETLDFAPKTAFYRRTNQDEGNARPTMEEIRSGKSRLPKPETPKIKTELDGSVLKLGWIQGVLVRCLLNIWGVMLFIRISWVVGQAGIAGGLGVILLSAVVTSLTTISLAAICTNGEVKGGGAYYLISRSLGPEFGGAIGVLFSVANAIAVAMYIVGFAETLVNLLETEAAWSLTGNAANDMRVWGLLTLLLLFGISMAGMAWESKAQIFLLIMLVIAMCNFFIGTFISSDTKVAEGFTGYSGKVAMFNMFPHFEEGEDFFSVFSVFFPAATGIMAGANISGDLQDPSAAIPKGTIIAIIVSTISYCVFAAQAGATTLLAATGNFTDMALFPENLTEARQCIFNGEQKTCEYGLLKNYQVMTMISGWGPLITIGIFAATLSSALASLVSAPKVFQAVCKDKLFPYIGWFGKGYGANNEPYRAYVLALIIAAVFICIAELNAIAPIITNFFLISYTLINYSCFEASLSNSPGWRPSYKYYNTWVSFIGSVLCAAVMFVVSWWTALITVVIIYTLYRYIAWKKPPVNWGSSKQALKYNTALSLIHEVSGQSYHVKNFRPQFLVLTGAPSSRPRLVSFMNDISKGAGVLLCGQIVPEQYRIDQYFYENDWLVTNKLKGFHLPVSASSFRSGVTNLLQSNGLGVIKANTLIVGYKHCWKTQDKKHVEEYVGIIKDAFDYNYAVGILRYSNKLDVKHLRVDDLEAFGESTPNNGGDNVFNDTSKSEDKYTDKDASLKEDASQEAKEDASEEAHEDCKKEASIDIEMNTVTVRVDTPASTDSHVEKFRGFSDVKPKGSVDVYWLSDDGGLSILIPYLLSQSPYWKGTTLRVYTAGQEGEMKYDKVRMATLLNKFRIEFGSVEIVVGLDQEPGQQSIEEYMQIKPEEDSATLDSKTKQYIRIGELLRENATEDTQLIVLTLPVPRDHTPAVRYMSWLETMTHSLPPILLLRGNQQDALTFYC